MTDMPAPIVATPEAKWLAPLMMFVLGFSGMMIGLAIDLRSVLPQAIVALCTQPHSLGDSIALHAALLPATNGLMFASGIVAAFYAAWPNCAGRRAWRSHFGILLPALACNLAMLAGMFLSEWLAPQIARELGVAWTVPAIVGAMTGGMAGGMALWSGLEAFAARRFNGHR